MCEWNIKKKKKCSYHVLLFFVKECIVVSVCVFIIVPPVSYARVDTLLEAWEGLNISNGPTLLRDLSLPHRRHDSLSLRDLAAALEAECQLPEEEGAGGRVTLMQMTLLTYLHEIKFLRWVTFYIFLF